MDILEKTRLIDEAEDGDNDIDMIDEDESHDEDETPGINQNWQAPTAN